MFGVASFLFGGSPESDMKSVLDLVPARVAVIDGGGCIQVVNAAWRTVAWGRGDYVSRSFERGLNYLDLCASTQGRNAPTAWTIAHGLRTVLKGSAPSFQALLTWSLEEERRDFICMIVPLGHENRGSPSGAVVMHVDVPAEEYARAASDAGGEREAGGTAVFSVPSVDTIRSAGKVIDWLPAMVGYVDTDLVCRAANRCYQEWFGIPAAEIIGMRLPDMAGQPLFQRIERHVQQALAGEAVCFEDRFEIRPGQQRWFRATYIPDRGHDGQVRGFSSIAYDITAIKEMESRQEKAHHAAEQCRRAHSAFLEHIDHELKSPLASIGRFAEALATEVFGPLDDRYREYARDIRDTACDLVGLVNDLDDLARIQAGQFQLDEERVDLRILLTNGLGRAEQMARKVGIRLRLAIPAQTPSLFADRRLVHQMALNTVTTVITLAAEGDTVHLAVRQDSNGLTLTVTDTAVRLESEVLEHLLEPFGYHDRPCPPASLSTGVALLLAHHYMDLHGGTLQLTGDLQSGIKIIASFPRVRVVT